MTHAYAYLRTSGATSAIAEADLMTQRTDIQTFAAQHGYVVVATLEERPSDADLNPPALDALQSVVEYSHNPVILVCDRARGFFGASQIEYLSGFVAYCGARLKVVHGPFGQDPEGMGC